MNCLDFEGPCVNLIFLLPDGTMEDRVVDMTPRKDPMGTLLGGRVTINGTIAPLDAVIVCKRDPGDAKRNKHTLPPPFHRDKVRGAIVLVRMDKDAIPRDVFCEEYRQYCATFPQKGLRHKTIFIFEGYEATTAEEPGPQRHSEAGNNS